MKRSFIIFLVILLPLFVSCDFNSSPNSISNSSASISSPSLTIPTYDDIGFVNRSIYTGILTERVVDNHECLSGIVCREAYSSKDRWLGIEMTITLPYFEEDKARSGLDFPEIYFEVISNQISKAGLVLTNDEVSFYKIFWKYSNDKESEIYYETFIGTEDYKYYPGDKVRMSLFSNKEHTLQLMIELLEDTKFELYKNLNRETSVFVSDEFVSNDHLVNDTMYKRIIAINNLDNHDYSNNKIDVNLSNAIIESSYLYRLINNDVYKLPFNDQRSKHLSCGDNFIISISYETVLKSNGGEIINITSK